MVFVEETTESFLAFDIDCSFKVDLQNLRNIRFRIVNRKAQDEVLHDGTLDLQAQLGTFFLEQMLFHKFQLQYKGVALNAVVSFLLVAIPRNLEISHLILRRELIDTNFEQFGELLKKIENYVQFRKHFFPPAYLEEKYRRDNVDFFYFFNYSLPRDNDFVRHQENMLFNSFKFQSLNETVKLMRAIYESKHTQESLVRDTHKSLEFDNKKGKNPIRDLLVKVANLLSNQERLLLTDSLREFEVQHFISEKWLDSQTSFSKPIVLQISQQAKELFKEMKHLTDPERLQAWSVTIKSYLLMENNVKQNERFPLHFSRHFLTLFAKISQLNSPFL